LKSCQAKGTLACAFIAVLSLLTLGAFWPVLHNGFIEWDDKAYVWHNARVLGGLSWANVEWAFRAGYQANWHPLTWLSHMLDVELFGLRPGWHHFTSLLLHLANALLLFTFLRRATASEWRSFFVAALFAVHPLHVESVAWVAERKDVLSTFFFMLTLLAYARYVRSEGEGDEWRVTSDGEERSEVRGQQSESDSPSSIIHHPPSRAAAWYASSLLSFALGLMSKPMLVTLPFVLLLLDVWPLDRVPLNRREFKLKGFRRLLVEKLPFFALSLGSCWLTWVAQSRGHATYLRLPLSARSANAIVSYVIYLGQTFWPAKLAIFYPHPDIRYPISTQWPVWWICLAGFGLLLISGWAVLRLRRAPWFAAGWFWYLGTLVPVIGLVQAGAQARADRYTYIPLIGIFICVVWGISLGMELATKEHKEHREGEPKGLRALCVLCWPKISRLLIFFGLVAVFACAVLTHRQVKYWRNNSGVFQHALAATHDNATALYFVGRALKDQGRTNEAIADFRAAIAADPSFAHPHYELGIIFEDQGKISEAAQEHLAALQAMPWLDWLHNHFGTVLWSLGRRDEALAQFREAVRCMPDSDEGYYNLGVALAECGDYAAAAAQFEAVLRLKPADKEARQALAEAQLKQKAGGMEKR
jgi:tetratricopeptide (TPR) repeat protein